MEPNDVDCNANNVHAQAQFHLQAKANIHIQSQRSTDAATKASRGVPSKKKYIPSPMCSCLMLSRQWHWEGWPQGAWMHKNTRAWQDTTNTQGESLKTLPSSSAPAIRSSKWPHWRSLQSPPQLSNTKPEPWPNVANRPKLLIADPIRSKDRTPSKPWPGQSRRLRGRRVTKAFSGGWLASWVDYRKFWPPRLQ